jgi:thioesterase domain-containing protein
MVRLRNDGDRPPVYCFAGAGGAAAFFDVFARLLGPDQPVVGFQVKGFEGPGIPDWTVRRTARRHVRDIERSGSEGPVVLVGHSLGGLVALEVAHLLRAGGRQVGLVVLLDTYLPPALRPQDAPPRWEPAEGSSAHAPAHLFRTRLQVLLAGIWRHRDWRVHQEVFHQHGARIAHVHRPTPWPGRAVVVLSNENNDEPGWWAPVLSGAHDVLRIDADHVALLKRPYVDQVAELVRSAVDQLAREGT